MFNIKKVKKLENELELANLSIIDLNQEIKEMKKDFDTRLSSRGSMADLMRESLGMTIDFSEASKDKCMPKHYLADLEPDRRKAFVSNMETIYVSDDFQAVVRYMINVFAMTAIYKEDEQARKNGQIAVIAFRTLLNRFEEMHLEFLESKRNPDDSFDDQEILPE